MCSGAFYLCGPLRPLLHSMQKGRDQGDLKLSKVFLKMGNLAGIGCSIIYDQRLPHGTPPKRPVMECPDTKRPVTGCPVFKGPDYQTFSFQRSSLPNVQITKRPVTKRPVTGRPYQLFLQNTLFILVIILNISVRNVKFAFLFSVK